MVDICNDNDGLTNVTQVKCKRKDIRHVDFAVVDSNASFLHLNILVCREFLGCIFRLDFFGEESKNYIRKRD